MGIWTNTKLRIAKDKGLDPRNLNDDEEKQVRMATKKLFGSGVAGAYIWVADTATGGYGLFAHEETHAEISKVDPTAEGIIYDNGSFRADTKMIFSEFIKDCPEENQTTFDDQLMLAGVPTGENNIVNFFASIGPTIIFGPLGYVITKNGFDNLKPKRVVAGGYLLTLAGSTSHTDTEAAINDLSEIIKQHYAPLAYTLTDLPVFSKYVVGMLIATTMAGGIYKTGEKVASKIKSFVEKRREKSLEDIILKQP